MSVDPEYTILRLAFKKSTLEEIKRLLTQGPQGLDDKRVNSLIGAMRNAGLIDVAYETTQAYEDCLEEKSSDKRVKNPEEYCLKRHPLPIRITITEAGLVELINRAYQHYSRFTNTLRACVEVAREFKGAIGERALLVYDIDIKTCVLASELINRDLYLKVRNFTRWSDLPLVVVYHKRPRYKPA